MLLVYTLAILGSFALTFILAIPFIKLLYKFNIRRISKQDLDAVLPGRQIKFGTPIMGGAIILISIIILSSMMLFNWVYLPVVIFTCIVGGIIGGIDEYTNTLGRTFKALRISKTDQSSLFPMSGIFFKIKNILLMPWKMFEESLRMMGSQQRGLKSHYKLLMHIGLAAVMAISFVIMKHPTNFNLGLGFSVDLGALYFILFIGMLIFFANAFGITDGMDGLSAGTHTVSFVLMGVYAASQNYTEAALLSFIVAGAELAFLYFNIYPARMEMSDVGTVPLGMLLVFIAFLANFEFPVVILGLLYVIEILSSIIQVWSVKLRGKRVFLVAPIHHHFEKLGWQETKVTTRFWLFNSVMGLLSIAFALLR